MIDRAYAFTPIYRYLILFTFAVCSYKEIEKSNYLFKTH